MISSPRSDAAGASAVHTHMTNTRLGDVEIIEQQYPIRIERFEIRTGSGGAGQHPGGDGVIRRILFLEPVSVSLLTQRRNTSPPGLAGGGDGQAGQNVLTLGVDGSSHTLAGLAEFEAKAGDALEIHTPGGGAYGPA